MLSITNNYHFKNENCYRWSYLVMHSLRATMDHQGIVGGALSPLNFFASNTSMPSLVAPLDSPPLRIAISTTVTPRSGGLARLDPWSWRMLPSHCLPCPPVQGPPRIGRSGPWIIVSEEATATNDGGGRWGGSGPLEKLVWFALFTS